MKDSSWIEILKEFDRSLSFNEDPSIRYELAEQAIEAELVRIIGKDEDDGFKMPSDAPYAVRIAINKRLALQRQRAGITPQLGREEVFEQD